MSIVCHYFQRTTVQLKRLWDKIKRSRKEQLATERREMMATGGGPPRPTHAPEPAVDKIVPYIHYEIDVMDDSDGIQLHKVQECERPGLSTATNDLAKDQMMAVEDNMPSTSKEREIEDTPKVVKRILQRGFGCFMQEHIVDPQSYGIYIVDRRFISLEDSVQQLAQYMYDFARLSRRQRIIQRNRTERLSDLLDWRNLGVYYRQSRMKALHSVFPDYKEELEAAIGTLKYPRPISEPPSPSTSRGTTPVASRHGSDDEESDSVDEEKENPYDLQHYKRERNIANQKIRELRERYWKQFTKEMVTQAEVSETIKINVIDNPQWKEYFERLYMEEEEQKPTMR
ncbi:unnamed protein product, partial [Callosobruchus maculatus]